MNTALLATTNIKVLAEASRVDGPLLPASHSQTLPYRGNVTAEGLKRSGGGGVVAAAVVGGCGGAGAGASSAGASSYCCARSSGEGKQIPMGMMSGLFSCSCLRNPAFACAAAVQMPSTLPTVKRLGILSGPWKGLVARGAEICSCPVHSHTVCRI